MALEFNPADPPGLLAALQAAYYALIAGSREQIVEFDAGNGSRQSVTFHKPDLPSLKEEIAKLQAQVNGKGRFALATGGYSYNPFGRSRWPNGGF